LPRQKLILGREKYVIGNNRKMARWRNHMFSFMSRNAADAEFFFILPGDQVIEIGVQLEI
jgi:KUP system potassium uptake protein